MTAGSSGISAAGSAHPVIISRRRRRPADSRPAACRIILIRDSGANGAMSGRAFTADSIGMTLGDAINLPFHRAGVSVDVDRDQRHAAEFLLAIARRTAFGSF